MFFRPVSRSSAFKTLSSSMYLHIIILLLHFVEEFASQRTRERKNLPETSEIVTLIYFAPCTI